MACFEYGTLIDLAPRETVTLPDVRGATLRITRGTVWITQENDTRDTVLRPGDTWTVERNGLTILEAQGDVTLCVVGRRVEALLTGRKSRTSAAPVWSRTRDALASLLAAFVNSPRRGPAPYV